MKFKVGDKVKVINNEYVFVELGSLGFIKSFDEGLYAVRFKGKTQHLEEKQLKLAKNKNKKRIKNLEKEVAELKLIVSKLGEPSNLVKEELVKSNNELRAEVIEKAKNFTKELYQPRNGKSDNLAYLRDGKLYQCDFIVNEKKKTVVALLRCDKTGKDIHFKAKSKCIPGEVFNEHIRKAIALGRALNLDVSEFENCVQPDEIVIGMKTYHEHSHDILLITDENLKYVNGPHKILEDTNAKYEVK